MSRATDYTNAAQQRILQLIGLLAGHELQGLAPSELAKGMNVTASTITRDLDNLRSAGWAEQTPQAGRWRLSPQVVQISLRHAAAIRAGEQTLQDVVQRFSRTCPLN
ncbi:MarR family transcriptional regulator [Delftia tsuruhatensis]|uniref:MarR family transcriptional regulator n=1 Tax=Delftia tsuruhatensis TaxID=180282 RepID=UPI0010555EB7|nr:MarR family transcriptional regulator [Delftia tsuruhatensis]MDH2233083.1 MarR family transcriptional regulator [Delftia tsuruhatensis]TDF28477.1 MarR family transcriptional regulator [Delftia tsuruhatensis]